MMFDEHSPCISPLHFTFNTSTVIIILYIVHSCDHYFKEKGHHIIVLRFAMFTVTIGFPDNL